MLQESNGIELQLVRKGPPNLPERAACSRHCPAALPAWKGRLPDIPGSSPVTSIDRLSMMAISKQP